MATKTATKKQAKPAKKHAPAKHRPGAQAGGEACGQARPQIRGRRQTGRQGHSRAKAKADRQGRRRLSPPSLHAAPKPKRSRSAQPLPNANGKTRQDRRPRPRKPGEETPGDADSPAAGHVGRRRPQDDRASAKTRGYVTYDELNKVLPSDKVSSEQIEDTMSMLNEMGINVIESEEQEEGADERSSRRRPKAARKSSPRPARPPSSMTAPTIRCACICARWARSSCSSREGEIAIAKRIEAGRELMIGALCESPLTFEALTVWRDELNEGKVLLRDIIDLEAMYGVGPEARPPPPAQIRNATPPAHLQRLGARTAMPMPRPDAAAAAEAQAGRRSPSAEGEDVDPGEAAAAADGAADADDFDDEGNLPLSAMEAALKPQVLEALDNIAGLYKKLGKLQDASVEAALASDELSTGQERRFKKLRNETMDLVKALKLNNNRIEALVDQMYGINRRLVSLEGRLLRLAEAHGVAREDFLKEHFGNELDPQLGAPRRPPVAHGLEGFRPGRARQDQRPSRRDPGAGARRRASRSANSAASCRRCRRASARRVAPRRR